jgi:hypothetical protein
MRVKAKGYGVTVGPAWQDAGHHGNAWQYGNEITESVQPRVHAVLPQRPASHMCQPNAVYLLSGHRLHTNYGLLPQPDMERRHTIGSDGNVRSPRVTGELSPASV